MPQNINLYVARPKSGQGRMTRIGSAAIVLALVAGGVALHRLEARRIAETRAALAPLAAESTRLTRLLADVPSPATELVAQIATEEQQVVVLEAAAARLAGGTLGGRSFSDQLRGLGRTTTAGVWLTAIRLDRFGSLTLEGRALDAARVPPYIEGLRREDMFAGTQFAAIEVKVLDGRDMPVHATAFKLRGADMQHAALPQKDMIDRMREREQKIRNAAMQAAAAPMAAPAGSAR